jgi:L-alanine-DL-glutamate epimerase-like enolase superfamily enzyme
MHGQSLGLKTIAIIEAKCEGFYGLGEAYVGIYIPEFTKQIVDHIIKSFRGLDIEQALSKIEVFKLPFVSNAGIYKSILGAIEISLFDLKARIKQVPLYKLFSEEAYLPKLYASGGSVITTIDDLHNDIALVSKHEISAFKLRIGKQKWEADLDRIKFVRDEMPNSALMVDAISGTREPVWSFEESLLKFKDLEQFNLTWLEEPLSPELLDKYVELKKSLNIPLAAGEAYSSKTEYFGLIEYSNIDIVQFDVTHSGGINIVKEVYEMSHKKRKKTAFHVWGSLIAQMANFHLALSMRDVFYFEVPLLELEINDYLISSDDKIFDLVKKIPTESGLGLSLDKETISKFQYVQGTEYKW